MEEDDFQPPRNFALLAAIFEGGLVAMALGLGWLLDLDPLETLACTVPSVAWGAAATVPPLGLLWICLKCPLRPLVKLVRVVDELLLPLFRNCRLAELAVIAALAGLGEEMLFRGIIQTAIADWVGGSFGQWVGLGVAAILFGLAHKITFAYGLLAGLLGLYLGYIWIVTDNLLVPIIAHAAYDFLALVYLVKVRGCGSATGDSTSTEGS